MDDRDYANIQAGVNNASAIVNAANELAANFANAYSVSQTNKDNREYNEKVRLETNARDDTAVQRRVNDLLAAGLSSTLAAGSAAGTTPIAPNSKDPVTAKALDLLAVQLQLRQIENLRTENAVMRKNMDKADAEISNLNASALKERSLATYYDEASTTQGTQRSLNAALAQKAAQDILSGKQFVAESVERTKGYFNERLLKNSMRNLNTQMTANQFMQFDNIVEQKHYLEQQIQHLVNTDDVMFKRLGLDKAKVVQSYIQMALNLGIDIFSIVSGRGSVEPHNPIGFR